MIDASTFANTYNAFWNAYTPTCEHFVRRLNMDGLERYEKPMAEPPISRRRALVAEYSFSLFVERRRFEASGVDATSVRQIEKDAWLETKKRLAPYVDQGLDLSRRFDKDEMEETKQISSSLVRFFKGDTKRGSIVLRPLFPGCGFVDASEGDVIFREVIFEIKTVARPFRSSDIRQTVTYAALNYASKKFKVKKLGLLNPRRGLVCEFDLDYVCSEISGRPAQELLAIVVQAISSGEMSR